MEILLLVKIFQIEQQLLLHQKIVFLGLYIKGYIKYVLKMLEEDCVSEQYSLWATGNVMVFGTRTDDEILVYVCKDYDELWIPLK